MASLVTALPFEPESAGAARSATRTFLHARGISGEASDRVAVVVSELVANAVVHGAAPVSLSIALRADVVVVAVADGGELTTPLTVGAPDSDHWGGRGLLLVEALTRRWGSTGSVLGGKVTWGEVAL